MEVLKTLKTSLEDVEKKIGKLEPQLEALNRDRERLLTTIETLETHRNGSQPAKESAPSKKSSPQRRAPHELNGAVLSAVRSGAETLPSLKELIGAPEPSIRNVLQRLVKQGEIVEVEKASGRKPTRYGVNELPQAA